MLRFDHVVIATRDLDGLARRYRELLGFDVSPGGRHTGRGTRNAIVRFGLDYLEPIAVYDEAEAEHAGRGALVRFLRDHEGVVAYSLATSDIDELAARLERHGVPATGPFAMERVRPDGRRLSWRLLVPGHNQYREPWPFLIQWDLPDDERLQLETPGRHQNGATAVAEVAVAVRDLDRGVDLYSNTFGLTSVDRSPVPVLAATSVTYDLAGCRLVILAPAGPGPIAEHLESEGEGPYYTVLAVDRLDATRAALESRGVRLSPAHGTTGDLLLDPDLAGARLLLRSVG